MKKKTSKYLYIALFFVLPIFSNAQKNCFIHVGFHGHAYNKTFVQLYVQNKEILSSNFDHSSITGIAGISLFFLPESDGCYYVTTTSSSGEHYFRPFFCADDIKKYQPDIFPLKVIIDGNIIERNIDLSLGRFIRIRYDYGKEDTKDFYVVQSHETFRDD